MASEVVRGGSIHARGIVIHLNSLELPCESSQGKRQRGGSKCNRTVNF